MEGRYHEIVSKYLHPRLIRWYRVWFWTHLVSQEQQYFLCPRKQLQGGRETLTGLTWIWRLDDFFVKIHSKGHGPQCEATMTNNTILLAWSLPDSYHLGLHLN